MLGHLLFPDIKELITARNFAGLREILAEFEANDLAELLEEFPAEDQAVVFRLLPRALATSVFELLPYESQESLLKALGQEQVASLLNDMSADDRTALLEELPAEVTRQLLSLLDPDQLKVAKTLLGYPEGSIGRMMTPEYMTIRQDWTVAQVLDHIRKHGKDSETLNVVYVVDDTGRLIDDIRSREFLLASLDKKVSDLMNWQVVSLAATDDQETAVAAFKKYDRTALPVTDSSGNLVGIVTVDDILDVAEAEATEDIQRMGGMEALEEPYLNIPLLSMVRKRAGWLVILFVGEMLTATAMAHFEEDISKAVVLAMFIPLIISSGGNSGSQASSLIIRALAIGELTLHDWWTVMKREFLSGLALGAILGVIGFLRIAIWSAFSNVYGEHWALVGITVGLALVGIVMWGSLAGSMLPILLKRIGFDPAVSSTPFVATLVDVTGILIYFGVASVILRGTLL